MLIFEVNLLTQHMKKLSQVFLITTIVALSHSTFAQKGFVEAQDPEWLVSVDEAYKESKKTNKPILANFTGSDWCGWCKKLRAEVFVHPEFKKWADENVVLLELDFPRRKQLPDQQKMQNQQLQQVFQVRGFPTIWLFGLEKPDGQDKFSIIGYGKTGYVRGGPMAFTGEVDRMLAAKKAAPNN